MKIFHLVKFNYIILNLIFLKNFADWQRDFISLPSIISSYILWSNRKDKLCFEKLNTNPCHEEVITVVYFGKVLYQVKTIWEKQTKLLESSQKKLLFHKERNI